MSAQVPSMFKPVRLPPICVSSGGQMSALSASIKKFLLARSSKIVEDGIVAASDDTTEIRAAVDELVNIEALTKPQKMDVSSIEAVPAIVHTPSEWVDDWMH